MAGEAYYNTGTATVAANSKTVTGTGTNWLSALGGLTAIKAGDKFGIHVGRPIIIASVDSNTQLTLEDNWPGPAQTNAAYKIELTNPDVIAVEAMRRLLGSLGSGVLYGLSQLPSTPSRLLGIDENGLAALLNSASAYGLLGTIPNAQIPTRLQAQPATVSAANALNNITETGWVSVTGGNVVTVGGPASGGAGVCFTEIYDANAAFQRYSSVGALDREWIRRKLAGVWSTWTPSVVGDVTNASTLASGDISDVVLNNGLKAQGLLSADVLYSGFDRLNTLSVSNFTKSQNGNNLVLTSTGTDPQLILPVNAQGSKSRYVAFRIKRTAGSLENIILYSTSGHGYSTSYRNGWTRENSGEWTTVVVDMWSLVSGGDDWKNSNIVNVRVDFTNASGGVIELAWIGTLRDSPSVYQQESVTDTRPGASMIVGAFGLGSQNSIPISSTSDLNSLPAVTAFYRWSVSSPPANSPIPVRSSTMIHVSFNVDAASQIVCSVNTNEMWYRAQAGGVWSSWTRIDGDVSGPTVAIDNAPVGFSGTSGKSIKQLTGPVAALHAVTGAANKLAYFTGAAAMATTDLTAFARTLLDDADAAAAWATLGAGQSLAANGWQRLPSGLILQWGSTTSTGNVTVAFPTAFPNACYGVFPNVTQPQPSTTVMYSAWADNITLSNFALRTRYALNGGTVAADTMSVCFWALGR
ncbi:pyocin knob domain-containing protein [Agrobacterium pusense]|uniref:pyocin knob domain-containing protein n=1 Tax=Agrobacterium pusense TaxID=648995 RepID=UPI003D1337BB